MLDGYQRKWTSVRATEQVIEQDAGLSKENECSCNLQQTSYTRFCQQPYWRRLFESGS